MSVSATYILKLLVTETPDLALDNATDVPFDHDIGIVNGTLDASSTVPATKCASDTVSLAAGQATLDLTSLTGPMASSVTFNGLKVQALKFKCPSTNTGGITISKGDATAYNLFGADNASSESIEIMPGGCEIRYTPNNGEDVDATHKDVKFVGTGTDVFSYVLVAG